MLINALSLLTMSNSWIIFIYLKESLARHAKLNARESELNGTAVYGVNQFSDWTPEEFRGVWFVYPVL